MKQRALLFLISTSLFSYNDPVRNLDFKKQKSSPLSVFLKKSFSDGLKTVQVLGSSCFEGDDFSQLEGLSSRTEEVHLTGSAIVKLTVWGAETEQEFGDAVVALRLGINSW